MREKKSFLLSSNWYKCPVYWQNFVISLDFCDDEEETYRYIIIEKELKKFNATRFDETHSKIMGVEFNTPADYTWFLLRWS